MVSVESRQVNILGKAIIEGNKGEEVSVKTAAGTQIFPDAMAALEEIKKEELREKEKGMIAVGAGTVAILAGINIFCGAGGDPISKKIGYSLIAMGVLINAISIFPWQKAKLAKLKTKGIQDVSQ